MKPLDCLPVYEDAWLYDQEFRDRVHEIPFYVRRAMATGGPLLELACGTGRLTLPIAAAGIEVAGVDVSMPMIERARTRAAAAGLAVAWHVGDVRRLELGRRFRLAFVATNALQHLHDVDSLLAFFAAARRHLTDDGALVLDVFHPAVDKLARRPGPRPHKTFALDDGRTVRVEVDGAYERASQILHFVLTYRIEDAVLQVKDVRMRCFFPEELLALCRMGGFDVVERLGDYDERPFSDDAPQQILVCRPHA